jgi:uroporphyrin-III C-methyltransferase
MGIHNLPSIVEQLQEGGLLSETSIALVRWGTCPQQIEITGNLGNIVKKVAENQFEAPAIAIIGKVVELHGLFPSLVAFSPS